MFYENFPTQKIQNQNLIIYVHLLKANFILTRTLPKSLLKWLSNTFFVFQPQLHDNNVFSIWTEMLQLIEEKASNYATHLQGLEGEILKDVKKLKANKQQRNKKFFERVSFLQKEVESSVQEVSFIYF